MRRERTLGSSALIIGFARVAKMLVVPISMSLMYSYHPKFISQQSQGRG
jgi:hypothetical protein